MSAAQDIVFSVIMPSYNEASHIKACIESVLANEGTDIAFEIIVVDNCSSDGTPGIARDYSLNVIEHNECKRKTIGSLRNVGARKSSGSILAFLDADMIVPPYWLQKAKEFFDSATVGALGFTEGVPDSAGWVARTWGDRMYQKLDKVVDVGYLPGRNFFINRTVFEEISGFDETLETNEDKDLSIRIRKAGYRLISIPETGLFHLGYEQDLWNFLKKEFWRQGSSLAAARRAGLSLRTLRAPLLSFWHILLFSAFILSFFLAGRYIAIILLLVWISPSAVIALTKLTPGRPMSFTAAFFILTFLRWNVSGLALLWQLLKGYSLEKQNNRGIK
jgi:glycosyltransferase involved in cell wall biosynthesis